MASFRWRCHHGLLHSIEYMYVSLSPLQIRLNFGPLLDIARILKKMQEQQMKNRDKRTRLMSEFLANIKRYYLTEHLYTTLT